MKSESKNRVLTFFTILIMMVLLVFALVKGGPLYNRYVELKKKDSARDVKIREIEIKTAELNEAINTFGTSDESVESAARAERRYPPNETIYIFERPNGSK